MTKPLAVVACCLALLAMAPGPARPEEVKLVPLPLLACKIKIKEVTEKHLLDIALPLLAQARPSGDGNVSVRFLDVPDPFPAGLDALPDRRGAEAAELLEPVKSAAGADGALAFWLENDAEQGIRTVALLYLPKRIELERFTVSVNLERESFPLSEHKITPDGFRAALGAVLSRNLDRIVPPVSEATATEADDEGGLELATDDALDLAPEEGDDAPAEELTADPPPPADGGGHAARSPPERIGVLPFSRRLHSDEQELRTRFGAAPFNADLQALTAKAAGREADVKRLDGPALTFEQLEAPPITIAAHYDASARRQWLTKSCREAGVDALLIGHLREEDGTGGSTLVTYLRLFLADAGVMETASRSWTGKVGRDELVRGLEANVATVFTKAGVGQSPGGLEYRVRKKDTLTSIARRCYGDPRSRLVDALAELNHLPNRDRIKVGAVLQLPEQLEGVQLRKHGCV